MDQSGDPMTGAQVEASQIREENARISPDYRQATAGEGGRYRFVLTQGKYKVSAKVFGNLPSPGSNIFRGAKYDPTNVEVEARRRS